MKAKLEIPKTYPQMYLNTDGEVFLVGAEGGGERGGTVICTTKSNWGQHYIGLDFSNRAYWTPLVPEVEVTVTNALRGEGSRDTSLFPSLYRNSVDGRVILFTAPQRGTLLVPVAGEEFRIGEFSEVWEVCSVERSNWTRLPEEASVILEQE